VAEPEQEQGWDEEEQDDDEERTWPLEDEHPLFEDEPRQQRRLAGGESEPDDDYEHPDPTV
jgi:hypothetical protein